MKITWDRKEARIWTAIVGVRFETGFAPSTRPVAFRIAPENMATLTGDYIVDLKSMSVLPWQNVGGTRTFGTKALAASFAKRYIAAMGEQNTYVPSMGEVAS